MDITLQGTVPVRILKTDLVPSKVYDVADNPSLTLPSLVSVIQIILQYLFITYIINFELFITQKKEFIRKATCIIRV